ncbi:MAG TPA: nuclear transport factor 2 family protein [Vicinamibacterales bacterium]
MKSLALVVVVLSAAGGWVVFAQDAATDDVTKVLQKQTQALMDAVSSGDARVWDRYLDPAVLYLNEDGVRKNKADVLKGIVPLPKGISGSIMVSALDVRLHGDTAIATHNDLETENYFGHRINAEYRTTDTWMRTPQGWKLVASQVHAQQIDPTAIRLAPAKLDEYVGVYRLNDEITYTIRRQGDGLSGVRSGRQPQTLSIEAADVMFVAGQPRSRKIFLRLGDGRISGFVDRREGREIPWTKVRQ